MSLFKVFDERNESLAKASYESNLNTHNDNFLQIFGEEFKWINGTFSAFIRRGDLFGVNSLNFLYALYVGKQYKKESLYQMFRNFMNKSPETKDANILFLWAEELRKYKNFIDFEPTFQKLNSIMDSWFTRKTIFYEGRELPISLFKPILYNTAGINLIELLPYIGYLYCYLIYGFPFTFSDAYSTSSLQSFYNMLENWFSICYSELYKEQGFNVLTTDNNSANIPDELWKKFYTKMLDAKKIIEIRNNEINKTDAALKHMTETQKSIVDEDLEKKYNIILTNLVKIASEECSFKNVFKSIRDFDEKFYKPNDVVNLTSYFVSNTDYDIIIDSHNKYKYMLYNGNYAELPNEFKQYVPKTKLNPLNYSMNKPFIGADVIMNVFVGLLRERFVGKRENQFDESPIYLYPNNLKDDEIFKFIMPFFVRGIWAFENREMSTILTYLMSKEKTRAYIIDLIDSYETFKVIYGYRTKTILTPVYALSLLNSFLYLHCKNGFSIDEFNPFIYLKQFDIDKERIIKLENILYACLFIFNDEYVKLVNNLNIELYNILQNNPLIMLPYVQTISDDSRYFNLGGCDAYKYSRFPNPFVRSFGFMSNVMGADESIDILYRYTEHINNLTVFELIESNKNNVETVINNIITATQKYTSIPELLYKYVFTTNEMKTHLTINERSNKDFAFLIDPDTNKYVVEIMLNYAFKQTLNSNVLDDEYLRIKEFTIDNNMKLDPSIPSTINKFSYKNNEYTAVISPIGKPLFLPYLGVKSEVNVRNVNFASPAGMYHYKLLIPSKGIDSEDELNTVIWLFSNTRPLSKFDTFTDIKASGLKPYDGSFMFTDRIQQFAK